MVWPYGPIACAPAPDPGVEHGARDVRLSACPVRHPFQGIRRALGPRRRVLVSTTHPTRVEMRPPPSVLVTLDLRGRIRADHDDGRYRRRDLIRTLGAGSVNASLPALGLCGVRPPRSAARAADRVAALDQWRGGMAWSLGCTGWPDRPPGPARRGPVVELCGQHVDRPGDAGAGLQRGRPRRTRVHDARWAGVRSRGPMAELTRRARLPTNPPSCDAAWAISSSAVSTASPTHPTASQPASSNDHYRPASRAGPTTTSACGLAHDPTRMFPDPRGAGGTGGAGGATAGELDAREDEDHDESDVAGDEHRGDDGVAPEQ